jgi:hypothetical protein
MNTIKHLTSRVDHSLRSRYKKFLVDQRARLKHYRARFMILGSPRAVIWIFGCQRSGTTFLENTFRHDLDSAVFGEFSPLTIDPRKTVLSDLDAVFHIVQSQNARYAVIRPLFESDRAIELLNLFPGSVGIWLYRDCPHVVDSMIRKWEGRFFEISRRVESDSQGIWRLEEMTRSIEEEARRAVDGDPTAEIYARYWLARNRIPFTASLAHDPRMKFLSYRDLILEPGSSIESIMRKAGFPGVWKDFKLDVRTSSLDKPVRQPISGDTLARCEELHQDLMRLVK